MHDLASFTKTQLILLAFKGFSSSCYYLAAILFEGNELTAGLQTLVNLGDNHMIWIKQLQCSRSSAEVSLDLLNVSLVPWTLLAYQYSDNFVCRALLDLSETLWHCCMKEGRAWCSWQGLWAAGIWGNICRWFHMCSHLGLTL